MNQLIGSTLKKYFGYDSFRNQQEEIILSILNKEDTLVLMPTGGGKSLCFQIPALVNEGTALVISPLISLMRDQVDALEKNGVSAAFYNSSQDEQTRRAVKEQLHNGELKLLYLAPETLFSGQETDLIQFPYSMVAVDEAHCVSMWGHDFRPEYTQLKNFRSLHPKTVFVGLTATADKLTRVDIEKHLGLNTPKVYLSSFDRPNIHLQVKGNKPKKKKLEEIVSFIQNRKGSSGIVYCLSRKETEEMAMHLNKSGVRAACYHAGLDSEKRTKVQQDFLNDSMEVICATIAFGMGIDKSNVRWVIHNNLPKNIEGYYQEIGRAGRDGLKSEAVLYYNYRDVKLLSDFAKNGGQSEVLLEKLNRMLQFAEASTCRRKILLAYFSENLSAKCGNCDVCDHPPSYFDGTKLAQMALSASKRANEKLGTLLLIDVLRGAKTAEIFEKNLNALKTYAVGKDYSWKEWAHYLTEMKNQGLFDIAYDENMHLKITPYGESILFGQANLELSNFIEKESIVPSVAKLETKQLNDNELLFDRLKLLRKKLAVEENVPPYIIFSDVSLHDMCAKRPKSFIEFNTITGVGEIKASKYAHEFVQAIIDYENKGLKKNKKSGKESTFTTTLNLLEEGLTVDEIAAERKLSETTVFSHIAQLHQDGKWLDLSPWLEKDVIEKVSTIVPEPDDSTALKPIYAALNEEIPYGKIRLTLSYLIRRKEELKDA